MKKILKKHWLLILILSIPYFFVVLSGCIKVNFDMTAPGSLNQVGNVININDENEEEGSFNTVSVYSVEKINYLTYLIGKLDKIVEKHLDILNEVVEPEDEDTANNNLVGYTFVITGKLNNFKNRTELKNVIESRGGKVRDSITALTSYLINNDINSTSAKNKKAKELNVEIITEENFMKIFDI